MASNHEVAGSTPAESTRSDGATYEVAGSTPAESTGRVRRKFEPGMQKNLWKKEKQVKF